ncbi:hypothetical protein G6F35_014940 [Rhizopus arrhizus]|nr:hypothetical protein G6F35_014940 [Rhizopus arrhizus]
MALEQVQEAHPLVAVFLVDRVAARRVQQDAFGREEPVAVTGAAYAAHGCAVLVGERELQPRIDHGAALAGGGVADDDVPRQLVQRFVARGLADLGRLDGAYRLRQARAQRVDLVAVGGGAGRGACLHLLFQHVAQLLVGAPGAAPAPQPHAEPQEQQHSQQCAGPGHGDLHGVGEQEQKHDQRDQSDHHEGAWVGEHPSAPVAEVAHGAGKSRKQS